MAAIDGTAEAVPLHLRLWLELGGSGGSGPETRVDVLGHQDVALDVEAVPLTAGFKRFFEADAGGIFVQEGIAAIATEGEEVEMALVLVTLQARRHGSS